MKRIIAILLVMFLLLMCCSCSKRQHLPLSEVRFYYKAEPVEHGNGASIIAYEDRQVYRTADDVASLIEQYLQGSKKNYCKMPFPAGTTLVQYDQNKTNALIQLSAHAALLSGSELMVACVCLGKTIMELTNVTSVQISADGHLLNNQQSITVTPNNFVLFDATD